MVYVTEFSKSTTMEETATSEADSETESGEENETPTSTQETSSSPPSRKKHTISNCEILAQMKNRHEEIVLNSRLRSLNSKQCREEDSLARAKKKLIETMKKCKRTSGSSPDPRFTDQSVTPIIYKYYQTPWAYSFNHTTYNSLYKEIEQLPRRSFKNKSGQSTGRASVKSAPSNQRTAPSLIDRSSSTSYVDFNDHMNEMAPLLKTRRKPIMRPQSCGLPAQSKDRAGSGSVHFDEDTVRPHTCKNDSRLTQQPQVQRKQSWIKPINRANSNPIIDTSRQETNKELNDEEFVQKYLGSSDKVNRYRYYNHKKDGVSQVVYRGQKLKNYIKPQDRYKRDPLNLMKREKMVIKLSLTDSKSLEESRKAALKAGEAFPKAARVRMLNELIASNNDKSGGPHLGYDAELQARIEHFLSSIDEFCDTRSTYSLNSAGTGSVNT